MFPLFFNQTVKKSYKKLFVIGGAVALFVAVVVAVIISVQLHFLPPFSQWLVNLGIMKGVPTKISGAEMFDSFNRNDFNTAITGADAFLAKNPKNINALLIKSNTLAQQGSLTFNEKKFAEQAISTANQVLAVDQKNSEAWRVIGYSNEIMQKYEQAHDAYAKSLALNPNNWLAMFNDAHAWDLQGDMDKAEAGYRKSLSLNPSFDQALIGMGRVLVYKNDIDGALADFIQVASSSENARISSEASYSASTLLLNRGELSRSEEFARKAIEKDPSYPLGWTGLGEILFLKATQIRGDSSQERLNLLTDSLGSLDKAIKLNPNQSLAHFYFALAFYHLGENSKAIDIFKKTQTIIPNDITLSANAKADFQSTISDIIKSISISTAK